MRRQYHPKQQGRDLLIWDVARLVRLSKGLPERSVPLNSLADLDTVRWFDRERNQPTCRAVLEHMRLVLEADTAYPVLLGEDGRVMDGMHRVLRVALEGGNEIRAKRFETDPDPDYRNVSLEDLPY